MFVIRRTAISALFLLAIADIGGCSSTPASPSPTPPSTPPPTGPSSTVSIPVGAEALANRAYVPDALNVAAGTTVTWTNTDSVAHTSTSDADGWNSGIIAPGGQFSVAFPTAGTFSYRCTIHPGMIGTVVVQ